MTTTQCNCAPDSPHGTNFALCSRNQQATREYMSRITSGYFDAVEARSEKLRGEHLSGAHADHKAYQCPLCPF